MTESGGVRMLAREAVSTCRQLERLLERAETGSLARIDVIIQMAQLHELCRSIVEAEWEET